MKLWKVTYRTWCNRRHASAENHVDISVGETAEEAIQRVREATAYLLGNEIMRNYQAEEITNVFGFNITVGDYEMREITYKYNVGDTVELKPKFHRWTEVMGTDVLITAAEIVERRDYNGPAYALGGLEGFFKENCFVGLACQN